MDATRGEVVEAESAERDMRKRILGAAFKTFTEKGYSGASTAEIATLAKVSKRDLYAEFGNKQGMLVACIQGGTAGMGLSVELPTPHDLTMLATTLANFGRNLLKEVSQPMVIAMFRLAIAEAKRSPEVARVFAPAGRGAARKSLADLLARSAAAGVLEAEEPSEMAEQYLALLWEGLMVNLMMGLADAPEPAEIERRVQKATSAFLRLHPGPSSKERPNTSTPTP
jgi:AcrR family transcriptional regulator